MALYVNTNASSLNAQRKLANVTLNLNTSYQRLSSGLRINSAKDDAAGLMITDRLTSQINGLNQGNRNANDGIALAQTIEGALDETTNMLQRIRTLAVQASNGTNTQEDRKSIQDEVSELCFEITRIAQETTFAGAQILDGKGPNSLVNDDGNIYFQVGANANDLLSLRLGHGFQFQVLVTAQHAGIGPNTAFSSAGYETVVCFHTRARGGTQEEIMADRAEGGRYSVSTQFLAQKTLAHIDDAIKFVDSKRAALGAVQNRMESTIRNQANISENTSDARSRIRDTDFAAQTAELTQNNIIQNASQSILAQANQRPTVALQLMGNI